MRSCCLWRRRGPMWLKSVPWKNQQPSTRSSERWWGRKGWRGQLQVGLCVLIEECRTLTKPSLEGVLPVQHMMSLRYPLPFMHSHSLLTHLWTTWAVVLCNHWMLLPNSRLLGLLPPLNLYSGMHWIVASRQSTMRWHERSAPATCRCTRGGARGTTMLCTRRERRGRISLWRRRTRRSSRDAVCTPEHRFTTTIG